MYMHMYVYRYIQNVYLSKVLTSLMSCDTHDKDLHNTLVRWSLIWLRKCMNCVPKACQTVEQMQ